jgi:hypothetical protein
VSIAILLVAVVIIAGVVVVAMGGGGELSREPADESADTDFRSWADVARYRPPAALLGYHAAATERSLQRIARAMADQDAEIALLRGKLAQYEPGTGPDLPQQSVPEESGPRALLPEQSAWQRPVSEGPEPDEQDAEPPADPVAQASQATGPRDDG